MSRTRAHVGSLHREEAHPDTGRWGGRGPASPGASRGAGGAKSSARRRGPCSAGRPGGCRSSFGTARRPREAVPKRPWLEAELRRPIDAPQHGPRLAHELGTLDVHECQGRGVARTREGVRRGGRRRWERPHRRTSGGRSRTGFLPGRSSPRRRDAGTPRTRRGWTEGVVIRGPATSRYDQSAGHSSASDTGSRRSRIACATSGGWIAARSRMRAVERVEANERPEDVTRRPDPGGRVVDDWPRSPLPGASHSLYDPAGVHPKRGEAGGDPWSARTDSDDEEEHCGSERRDARARRVRRGPLRGVDARAGGPRAGMARGDGGAR